MLIVDQWVETGGTMAGAIKLVEMHGGVVAGACEAISRDKHPLLTGKKIVFMPAAGILRNNLSLFQLADKFDVWPN